MALVTTTSKRLATKPEAIATPAVPGYVTFPGEAGDYLSVPITVPADAAATWRVRCVRPAAPASNSRRASADPFHLSFRTTTFEVNLHCSDGSTVGSSKAYTTLEGEGFPLAGELVDLLGEWNPTTDVLSWSWRAVTDAVELDDDTGWNLGSQDTRSGKQVSTTDTVWELGGPVASEAFLGDAYRWIAHVNGSLVVDVNPAVDVTDVDATTFEATTGGTVTVNRTGDPATELVATIPAVYRGHPLGFGDWRFIIELLEGSSTAGTWGADTWGAPTKWGSLQWVDITDKCRGVGSPRGADEPNGRPRVGAINLTVVNEDGEFSPWQNYARVRPGVVVRCAVVSDTDTRAGGWLPQWAGVVAGWPVTYATETESWCDVTIAETLSQLSELDDNALGSVVGSGDKLTARVNRLADASGWKYGIASRLDPWNPEPATTLQSTDMAMNRLAELYVTADSTGARSSIVRSDATGALLITERNSALQSPLLDFSFTTFFVPLPCIVLSNVDSTADDLWHIRYDVDSLVTANDTAGIKNDHRYTRVGGTQQEFPHEVSKGKFGHKVQPRTDLICTTDADALAAAQRDSDIQARTALRVESVSVNATNVGEGILAMAALDVGDNVWFFPPEFEGFAGSGMGFVRSLRHDVTPIPGGLYWVTTMAIDFHGFFDLPGAALDPAPR